ncbi:M36 family metallopeptidase [Actinoplanes sp. NPDC089786]|uniref:M36 family metallopeptidase n=1 Tax=Actinoplanes sp. NPDC089786 TaxID=3155185 RepID=UPI00343C3FA4
MHRRTRFALVAGLLATTTLIAAGPTPAGAAPAPAAPTGTPLTGEPVGHEHDFVDNRGGAVAPRAGARVAGARFNKFGTPARLTGKLATGLSKDPVAAAKQYLKQSRGLFALDAASVDNLQTVSSTPVGQGSVVLLRQRFGKLPAAHDGLVAVAVKAGDVLSVSSTLSPEVAAPEPATLTQAQAVTAALRDAKLTRADLATHRVRTVAMPMPGAPARTAFEVVLLSRSGELGYTTFIDARDGKVLVRENLVNSAEAESEDNPHWKVFVSTPTTGADSRATWCAAAAPECSRVVLDPATGKAWDIDPDTGVTSQTTSGNSAYSVRFWDAASPQVPATPSPTRDYTYPFTNQWNSTKCDPTTLASPQQADVDAATTNLFAMHNRMHDWSYHLGFTEATWNLQKTNVSPYGKGGDAERGNAQQGANTQSTRNNANQATPPDGVTPTTNMYMWQPIAGNSYPPCVDGDYDMTVIGHEYTHAISNRMIAGPDSGISSQQGGSMGESWSDLLAMEYLFESGYVPRGNTPYVTGGYVTGDLATGIRNYDMSNSPLNYSNFGYDRGPAVHADGEIWSATQFDVRRNFISRYGTGTRTLQESCANGQTPATECPGNRRWAQLVFDSFLLAATGQISMLDMRDNMITADALRFDGANADLLWNAFAVRGMGAGASSGPADIDPVASFASPYTENVELTFKPAGGGAGKVARLYIGDFDFGSTPVADTDPATPIPDTFTVVPGTYKFLAIGKGLGHKKFTQPVYAGVTTAVTAVMPSNLASSTNGATAAGDGVNAQNLLDDAEATSWSGTGGVAGRTVTVDLPGDAAQLVSRVQVSGLTGTMMTSVRKFEVLTCNARAGQDCATDAGYRSVFVSPDNAFATGSFRPKIPDVVIKSFTVRPGNATHVRYRTLTNQCTGNPLYAGEQDNDPRSTTDCASSTTPGATTVATAEFQVFGS